MVIKAFYPFDVWNLHTALFNKGELHYKPKLIMNQSTRCVELHLNWEHKGGENIKDMYFLSKQSYLKLHENNAVFEYQKYNCHPL